jgi:hypothetical protein
MAQVVEQVGPWVQAPVCNKQTATKKTPIFDMAVLGLFPLLFFSLSSHSSFLCLPTKLASPQFAQLTLLSHITRPWHIKSPLSEIISA